MTNFRIHANTKLTPLAWIEEWKGYKTADSEWLIRRNPHNKQWYASPIEHEADGDFPWGKTCTPFFDTREEVLHQLRNPGVNTLPLTPLKRVHEPVKKYLATRSHYASFDPTYRFYMTKCERFQVLRQHGSWRISADNCLGNVSVVNGFNHDFKTMRAAFEGWIVDHGFVVKNSRGHVDSVKFPSRNAALAALRAALDKEPIEARLHNA